MAKKTAKKKRRKGKTKATSLNAQQKNFCRNWVVTFNLADAWLAAGYKATNRIAAKTAASRFLVSNVYAQALVAELLAGQEQRADKTADDCIAELIKIGFANIQDYIEEDNRVRDISTLDRDKAAAIESIQIDVRHDGGDSEGYTEKVKLKQYSKTQALVELLDRWRGKAKQAVEVTGVVGTRTVSDTELARLLQDVVVPCDDAIAT